MPSESNESVPFFRPGYVKNNKAPDKIPISRLANLAYAVRGALDKGVISDSDMMNILAMSLLEGRSDYGANSNTYYAPKGSKLRVNAEKLYGNIPSGTAANPPSKGIYSMLDTKHSLERYLRLNASGIEDTIYTVPSDLASTPQLTDALGMILKYSDVKDKHPIKTVARYNGDGKAADKYEKLVDAIKTELQSPQNAELVDLFKFLTSPVTEE